VSDDDRAVAVAAILTALVRRTLPLAPAFSFDAPAASSGKTLLAPVQPEASSPIACRTRTSELASEKLYWKQKLARTPYPQEIQKARAANGVGFPAGCTSVWVSCAA
jgi:hypothetical protein